VDAPLRDCTIEMVRRPAPPCRGRSSPRSSSSSLALVGHWRRLIYGSVAWHRLDADPRSPRNRYNSENGLIISKRELPLASAGLTADVGFPLRAQSTKLRFGVGPLLPSPSDTIKAYTPIFDYLAKQLGVEYSLVSTTDWAGMGSGRLDLA
jgi:ABC-type phosphate/phosphonate transport system substrate-binding protein